MFCITSIFKLECILLVRIQGDTVQFTLLCAANVRVCGLHCHGRVKESLLNSEAVAAEIFLTQGPLIILSWSFQPLFAVFLVDAIVFNRVSSPN